MITPPPNKAKLFFFGAVLLAASAVVAGLGLRLGPWPSVLGPVIAAAFAGLTLWTLYRAARTSITDEGIAQPGLQGEVRVRWHEITSVLSERHTLRLEAPPGRVVVTTGFYADPAQVKHLVLARCADAGAPVTLKDEVPEPTD